MFRYGTACSTMNRRKLERIQREISGLRRGQAKAADVVRIAIQLGRQPAKRGKHPTFIHPIFRELRPLSIPAHAGKDLPPGTKNNILNQLDDDVLRWTEWLDEQGEDDKPDDEGETEQSKNGGEK